ncbi:MAG: response regulator [Chloroflexota bacterium]|nr:response regulator [Anaerolineales bacterium]MCB8966956.1 response regulator [Ardenticatenaceae bacterium]
MCKRILYVEDNPRNMLLVQRILEADGHELIQAWDGESGWETAVSTLPDLILMDLRLPGDMSGFELTRRLKANPATAHIPIVVLTAYGSGEAEKLAIDAGCDGFLSKPADIRQIRATLHQFFAPETAQTVIGAYHYAFI